MKKIIFYLAIFISLSFVYSPKIIDSFKKFSCENSGKDYLTLRSDNRNVCIEKFDDEGKECHFASECKGKCIWLQSTPINKKTPTSEGYYSPPQKENKGVCSKYNLPSSCYKNTQGSLDSWESILDNSGKPLDTGCPPPLIR